MTAKAVTPKKRRKSIDRKEFIRCWMEECGVTYDVATKIYESMIALLEKAVSSGQRVNLAKLGALVPHWQEARVVVMGMRRVRQGILKQKQTFILDPRIRYRFRIYKEWLATRHLDWYG